MCNATRVEVVKEMMGQCGTHLEVSMNQRYQVNKEEAEKRCLNLTEGEDSALKMPWVNKLCFQYLLHSRKPNYYRMAALVALANT